MNTAKDSISVAIACYNGIDYISEQLDTIRHKLFRPMKSLSLMMALLTARMSSARTT